MNVDLRKIEWGIEEAKAEIKLLQNNYKKIFVDISDIKKIKETDHLFLWGRRGCGKTAIAWKMIDDNKNIIKIDFEDAEEWVDAILVNSEELQKIGGFSIRKSYTDLWYNSILIEMMRILLQNNSEYFINKNKLIKYLNTYDNNQGIFQIFLMKLEDLFDILGKFNFVDKFSAKITNKTILELNACLNGPVEFNEAVKVLIQNLQQYPIPKIMIVVDSVDKWMLSTKFQTEAKQDFMLLSLLVRSLIRALLKLNSDKHFTNCVEIKAFFPLDLKPFTEDRAAIEHEIKYNHIMHWCGAELETLIAKRIAINDNFVWDKIFPFFIENHITKVKHKPFDYLLRHSQFRPREILTCCRKITDYANRTNKFTLNEKEYRDIVHQHCDDEVDRIINEFMIPFPNLYDVLNKFYESSNILEPNYVYSVLKNVKLPEFLYSIRGLVQYLYDIGFLGIILLEKEKDALGKEFPYTRYKNTTYYFSFKFIDPKRKISNAKKFVIHPLFYGRFSIKSHDKITICHNILT